MLKVLIVKTSSMGDMIHALPALTDASKFFPDIQFDWVAEKSFSEIPLWHKSVRKVIPVSIRKWRKNLFSKQTRAEWQEFRHIIDSEKYDFVIDAQGLLKSSIIVYFARGIKCGMDWRSVREGIASIFYDRRFRINKEQHAITIIRELFAKALGYPLPTDYPESRICLDSGQLLCNFRNDEKMCHSGEVIPCHSCEDISCHSCEGILRHSCESVHCHSCEGRNPDPHFHSEYQNDTSVLSENYLFFAHGTTHKDKFWLEEHWIELAKLASQYGLKVKLPWYGAIEEEIVKKIATECDNVEILPQSNLTTLAKIIANAKAVIAVDTGFSHLAAALNTPVISLYGPTNPNLIGTYSQTAVHLQKVSRKMADIRVSDVWQALFHFVF